MEEFLNHGSIGGTIAAKADGLDGGDDLRKPRDGVGDSRDRATKGSREKNGVEEGAMGADKENTRVVVVRVRVRLKLFLFPFFPHLTAEPGATKICSFVDSCHLSEENFGASKLPLALTNCFSKLASFLNDYFLPLP